MSLTEDIKDCALNLGYSKVGITTADSFPGYIDELTYKPSGQKASCTYASGVVTAWEYDPRQRLLRLTSHSGGESIQDPAQADAIREGRLAGSLNRDAIGHGVREGHADLHGIGRFCDFGKESQETVGVGKAGRNEGDECGLFGLAQRGGQCVTRQHCHAPCQHP